MRNTLEAMRLPLRRDDRCRFRLWLARSCAGKRAALLEPRTRGRGAPQRLALRISEVPPDGLMVGIDGQIVGAIKLDAVAVRIADIEEERVGDPVPAGTAFDVAHISRARHQ